MSESIDLPAVQWQQISSKQITLDYIHSIIWILILLAGGVTAVIFLAFWGWIIMLVLLVYVLWQLYLIPRRVRATGYQLRQDDLIFKHGVILRKIVAVPYGRMQLVDITRGPLQRSFGLSTLQMVTAAASTNVQIPGLPQQVAEQLRDHLVAVAETRRAGL